MARIVWSREALRRLDAIGDYLLDHSPHTVQATLNGLYNAIQSLELFPLLGRSVYGFESPNVRELIHEKYRIVYEVAGETVTISSIFHGAEDVEARLRELLG